MFSKGDSVRVLDYGIGIEDDSYRKVLTGVTGVVTDASHYVEVFFDTPVTLKGFERRVMLFEAPELEHVTPDVTRIPEDIRDALIRCANFTEAHGYKSDSSLQEISERALAWLYDNTEDA